MVSSMSSSSGRGLGSLEGGAEVVDGGSAFSSGTFFALAGVDLRFTALRAIIGLGVCECREDLRTFFDFGVPLTGLG